MADMVQVRRPSRGQSFQAPQMRLGRSQFDLGRTHKTTFDVGELIPYVVEEVLPGDTFTCDMMAFCRIFSPLDAPVMDNIELCIDWFFVPNRIVWDQWEDFLGAHDAAGAQDTNFTIPVISSGATFAAGTTGNYMGIPPSLNTTNEAVNSLPFRGYAQIYDEWYRDQNIIDPIAPPTDNGTDTSAELGTFNPQKSAKRHDYFTSCLPYLQKGTAQTAALAGTIDVQTDALLNENIYIYSSSQAAYRLMDIPTTNLEVGGAASGGDPMYVDLGDAGTVSINALRESAAIQRLLERDARGGTRHPEIIRAHFGVDVPDYRTQRPEYLAGDKGYINISPVARTGTEAASSENVGELYGIGTGTIRSRWAKSFVEHGYIFGILRARGDVSYQQGLHRMWSRSTKYDFMWPELAHLGEQEVLNKELWYQGDSTDDDVFGYQERYAEYRYGKSLITGKFNSDETGALDFWHLAEDFSAQPSLNQTFIEDATPMSRIQAVTTEPDFIIDGRIGLRVARALPVRPVPQLGAVRF